MRTFAGDIRLLELQDQRIMPWKNGGGITRELAVYPDTSTLDGEPFLWRISIADVATDGPFSAFPGYDRSIMLIAGHGMELAMQEATPIRADKFYQPLRFSGDTATHCRLLDGPVRDFNVMSARGHIEHHCDVISGGASEARWAQSTEALFCHCLHGNLIVKLRDMAEWNLSVGQSLWLPMQPGSKTIPVLLAPNSPQTAAILVSLRNV
ncbi:MAG TPA: HutD family protein [Gammaproteobacteria bacterium]|jgi:environmental stress-induced protein Ves|nr:HutD family protein [Gammaproteobacteria bacterium]